MLFNTFKWSTENKYQADYYKFKHQLMYKQSHVNKNALFQARMVICSWKPFSQHKKNNQGTLPNSQAALLSSLLHAHRTPFVCPTKPHHFLYTLFLIALVKTKDMSYIKSYITCHHAYHCKQDYFKSLEATGAKYISQMH